LNTEILLTLALILSCVVLILVHPRGREASIGIGAAILMYWTTRKKPAQDVPTITPKIPEGINYDDVHKMDDDVTPRAGVTPGSDRLREWANTPD
jgi:hypothetical protein